jgi:hypothetical protein
MKKFMVYVPCKYSELYPVKAETEEEAIQKVKDGEAHCIGEVSDYYGTFKAFEQKVSPTKKNKKLTHD